MAAFACHAREGSLVPKSQQRRSKNGLQLHCMTSSARSQPKQLGFEELAWSLFEYMKADKMFVYRASETGGLMDPVLALGALSLGEKQSFWASQLEPTADMLAADRGILESDVMEGMFRDSILDWLAAETWVVYPLVGRDGLLGAVLMGWLEPRETITEVQHNLAAIIARAMTLETDTARLYEITYQQRQQAKIAQETTQAILRRDSLQDTLSTIAEEAMRAADAMGCALRLLDDRGLANLIVQVGQPAASPFDGADPLLHMNAERLDAQTPFTIVAPSEPQDAMDSTVLVVAPLTSGQKTVGYLEIAQLKAYQQPKDLVIARTYADQAAVAVELDRLYARLQQTAAAEERARLARDLHDSVSQSIYAMTLYTRAARRQLEEGSVAAVEKYLSDLHTTAREALGEMRMLIYELRPMALERYGLKGILEQRLQSVEARSGLEVSLEFEITGTLPPHLEENLYHIALEALNNTIKYAQASRVWVTIRQETAINSGEAIRLVVRDDGVGFDLAALGQGGIGLKSIRERVEMLHGRLMIDARPGEGVTLFIEVPYGENTNFDR